MSKIIITDNITKGYQELCKEVYNCGIKVDNTYELIDKELILTDLSNPIISFKKAKSPSLSYLLAENVWYAYGSQDVNFIGQFASKWLNITDNGYTSNSAYGNILQYRFGFNQIYKIVELLKTDINSRRAILILNDPNENIIETLDEQCTMYIQLFIRNNKLDMHVYMRSNDLIYGLPYDIPAFVYLQKWIYSLLKDKYKDLKLGYYHHHMGSIHYYINQKELIQEICYDTIVKPLYEINYCNLWYLLSVHDEATQLYQMIFKNPTYIKTICKNKGILLGGK